MLSRYADFPVTNSFGSRPSDVVVRSEEVAFDLAGREPRLLDANGRYIGTLENTPLELFGRFLAACDGKRPIGAICSDAEFAKHTDTLRALVDALLGLAFCIPAVIDELEGQLRAVELLRFPSQPRYAMPREYWENSIVVRQALDSLYEGLSDFEVFCNRLRGLHRLATIGANATNYYGGAGGTATVPGEFRTTSIGHRFDERKKWVYNRWIRLLEVPYALLESGSIVSMNGVPFARIANHGYECHHPYGRAGEQLTSQLNEIRFHLAAARAASEANDRGRLLQQCALFHHAFAHAHPFANINNSIAMNIVNDLLGRAGIGIVPHLYFDQVAYFLSPTDYMVLFERAVQAHVLNDEVGPDRTATVALMKAIAGRPANGA
jgi:hypothetical protein